MSLDLVYEPKKDKLMKVAFFFSGGATGLKTTMEDNPDLSDKYEIVCGLTEKPGCKGVGVAKDYKIPVTALDYKKYVDQFSGKGMKKKRREALYKDVCDIMKDVKPDVIMLSGFMKIVSYPLITFYKNRIFNVHPADLSILSGPRNDRLDAGILSSFDASCVMEINNLQRKYKGEDTVTDAIINREEFLKSTVHFATEKFDEGPIIVQSQKIVVDSERVKRFLKKRDWREIINYGYELQERMKYEGDGPCIRKALELASEGKLSIDNETVFIENEEMPYKGLQLG